MKPSGASSSMPGALSVLKIFDDVEVEGDVVKEDSSEDIEAVLKGADLR